MGTFLNLWVCLVGECLTISNSNITLKDYTILSNTNFCFYFFIACLVMVLAISVIIYVLLLRKMKDLPLKFIGHSVYCGCLLCTAHQTYFVVLFVSFGVLKFTVNQRLFFFSFHKFSCCALNFTIFFSPLHLVMEYYAEYIFIKLHLEMTNDTMRKTAKTTHKRMFRERRLYKCMVTRFITQITIKISFFNT